ncbi:TSUP family transporter [Selenomonas ruminantium]|uniref:TSUP family transporter n=1 Tax=Selenomonas ruminantium TaxID=971 RepID=UPI00040EE2A7|nr:TSUP family transporter [Selenomonas ruminantium]
MEFLDAGTLAFLLFFGFMASFIDSVVGGGGLISVPALLWTGLPPVLALGTNKCAAVMGSFTSFITFVRSGKVDGYLMRRLFPLSFIGSALGVLTVQLLPPEILRPLVVIMLIAVLLYSIFKKDWGRENKYAGLSTKMLLLAGLVAFLLGFYDGFFGPGAGSFMLFGLLMAGFDFLGAAANARTLNFASNISAVIFFGYLGQIDFAHAIPMGLAMIAGAYCGANMALKKGVGYVRPLFIIMTTVLIGKLVWSLF